MFSLSSVSSSLTQNAQSINPFKFDGGSDQVKTSDHRHFADMNLMVQDIPANSMPEMSGAQHLGQALGDKVMNALGKVNNEIVYSDQMVNKMVTKPNSVDVHDVTIALQKADLSLNLTKSVIQRAITSYQSLLNLR